MTVMEMIERLENAYQFDCEAGPLKTCVEWKELKAGIQTAIDALTKTKKEFRIAGKRPNYVGSIYVDIALAALGCNKTPPTSKTTERSNGDD